MEAFAEDFIRGNVLLRILREDGRAGETEYLEVPEEIDDVAVALAEMAAVALIEYHYKLLIPKFLNPFVVEVLLDRGVQLLDGCEDDFLVGVETLDQLVGIVSTVYCARLESLVFTLGLGIQVVAVHDEENLIDAVQLCDQLRRLEGGQRLAGACGVPDIAVLVGILYTVQDLLHCVVLVRAKNHQAFVSLVQDNVLGDHLA